MNTANMSFRVVLRSVSLMLLLFFSCTRAPEESLAMVSEDQEVNAAPETHKFSTDAFSNAREKMVADQLIMRDIVNEHVLAAMRKIPRHEFVPENMRVRAYADSPLPIGKGQTISQPYIVALMTQLVDQLAPGGRMVIPVGDFYQELMLVEKDQNGKITKRETIPVAFVPMTGNATK